MSSPHISTNPNEGGRYLIVGVNQEVRVYQVAVLPGPNFSLTLVDKKVKGTFVTDIKIVGNTVFVGDILRSVTVFELKEFNRGHGLQLLQ